jgi:hypothetical protein
MTTSSLPPPSGRASATLVRGRPRAAEPDPLRAAHLVLDMLRDLTDRVEDIARTRELLAYQPTDPADGTPRYDAALRPAAMMKALRAPRGLR